MKSVLILLKLLLVTACPQQEPGLTEVRDLFAQASPDKESCEKLLVLLEPYNEHNNPTFLGYKAVGTMLMAKHSFNPFKKMSYFKKGRQMLDKAVNADPDNIELRFLRFASQTESPGFLGYRGEVEEDKKFLIAALPHTSDPRIVKEVKKFMKQSTFLTAREKEQINNVTCNGC